MKKNNHVTNDSEWLRQIICGLIVIYNFSRCIGWGFYALDQTGYNIVSHVSLIGWPFYF